MGHKKHCSTHIHDLPPQNPSPPRPQLPRIASPGVLCDLPAPGPDIEPSIREDFRRAFSCLSQGTIPEGFKIIQESISRHPNDVTLLRARAFMHFHMANLDVETRFQHLRDGVASAEQALALCPQLMGLTVAYTNSLFLLANEKVDYEYVIQLCQKALSIQDPVDPDKDVVVYQKETKVEDHSSKEAKIESAKRELRLLIQRSNKAAKTVEKTSEDDAAEKKKSAQSVGDDEMWKPFVISRKCQEVKRLAIERGLDEVRGLEHEVYMGGFAENEKGTERYLDRLGSKVGRKIRVLQYWKGLSPEEQRAFLKVDVSELEGFFVSDQLSSEILKAAIGFMKELRSWKFWECSSCEQRFLDGELWRRHLDSEDHFGVLSPEDAEILPKELDDAWLNKIFNGVWRPVDVDKTLKQISEEAKEKQEVGHDSGGESEEKIKDREMDIEEKWSYCDDAKRKGMLDRICSMFRLILSNACLSQSMVWRWLRLTRFQLEKKCPNLSEVFNDLEKTPLGICFLESEQLEMVYRMTCEIYKHCQMVALSRDGKFYDEVPSEEEYRETIDYSDDFSCLLLDERFLTGEFKPQTSSNYTDEEIFVFGLYGSAEIGVLVKSWKDVKAQKLEIADSAYQFIGQELELLKSLCKKKSWLSNYERAFHVVRNMFAQENNRRETMPSPEPQNLVRLLCQQRDMQLDINEEDGLFGYNVITDILGDARAACAENLGSEEPLFDIDTQVSDSGAHEDEERQMKDRQLVDAELRVLEVIELKRNDVERKLCIVDALIMKSLADIKRMKQNFSLSSAHDSRAIMLHLLKSFIRAHLENFADKDAEEKAQAAEKDLLTALALDSDKTEEKGKSTNVGKKSKKKKAFYKRKSKDKLPSGRVETVEPEKATLECSFPFATSGSISGSVTTDESRELEQQLMLTAEAFEDEQLMHLIESEGMTLEEMIENQRQIEDEIKQNFLEEQNKELNETASDNLEDDAPLVSSTGEAEEPSVSEPPQHTQAVTNLGDSAEAFEDEQLMHLIESEGMTLEEMIENQRQIEGEIKQNFLEEQNKEMNETASDNLEDDAPLVSSTGEAKEPSVSEPPQHTQAVTNLGDSIFFGTFKAPLFPNPREGDGSRNRNLPLPTEAYTEPGETNAPAEHQQAEKSGPITLPGTGTAEVGNSLPQSGNVGLDDSENVNGEDENVPDLKVGVHNPDVDAFNEPDMPTMHQVLHHSRSFSWTIEKRNKVCKSCISEYRGYSSA